MLVVKKETTENTILFQKEDIFIFLAPDITDM